MLFASSVLGATLQISRYAIVDVNPAISVICTVEPVPTPERRRQIVPYSTEVET
jgi:hypothetical protein